MSLINSTKMIIALCLWNAHKAKNLCTRILHLLRICVQQCNDDGKQREGKQNGKWEECWAPKGEKDQWKKYEWNRGSLVWWAQRLHKPWRWWPEISMSDLLRACSSIHQLHTLQKAELNQTQSALHTLIRSYHSDFFILAALHFF